jgi:hypothetical protein
MYTGTTYKCEKGTTEPNDIVLERAEYVPPPVSPNLTHFQDLIFSCESHFKRNRITLAVHPLENKVFWLEADGKSYQGNILTTDARRDYVANEYGHHEPGYKLSYLSWIGGH